MPIEHILNFVQWDDQISSAGQPSRSQLAEMDQAGIVLVINLGMPKARRTQMREDFILARHGITYVHIPVPWTAPTYRDLMHFFTLMDMYKGEKILVHCVLNMRATAFVYLYRVLCCGFDEEQARNIMSQVWQPDEVWQIFIDTSMKRYKEEKRNG